MQTYLKILEELRLETEKKLVAEVLMVLKRNKIPEERTVNEQSAQVVAAVNQLPQTLQNPAKTSDGKD